MNVYGASYVKYGIYNDTLLCAGVPAKFIKFKWSIDEIIYHESQLYPENERYTREELATIFARYQKKEETTK